MTNIVIPAIISLIVSFLGIFLNSNIDKRKESREITREKLQHFYSKVYSFYKKYEPHFLNSEFIGDGEDEDESFHDFNDVSEELLTIINNNIYYLDQKGEVLWNKVCSAKDVYINLGDLEHVHEYETQMIELLKYLCGQYYAYRYELNGTSYKEIRVNQSKNISIILDEWIEHRYNEDSGIAL